MFYGNPVTTNQPKPTVSGLNELVHPRIDFQGDNKLVYQVRLTLTSIQPQLMIYD